MEFEEVLAKKYPYLADDTELLNATVEKAKMFYYGLKFPSEPWVCEDDRPFNTFFAQQWILAACDELIEKLGFSSATAYKENGVSWTFDNAQLSNRLISMIKPTIGVIE